RGQARTPWRRSRVCPAGDAARSPLRARRSAPARRTRARSERSRSDPGAWRAEGRARRPPTRPAKRGGATPSRSPGPRVRSGVRGSFRSPFLELIEQRADVAQFLVGGAAVGECLEHELRGRAAERTLGEVPEELALRALLARARRIH